jgi:hypothetical protein
LSPRIGPWANSISRSERWTIKAHDAAGPVARRCEMERRVQRGGQP